MAGDVVNIKVCSPLKLHSGLTGNYHAICHYSYNLPLAAIVKQQDNHNMNKLIFFGMILFINCNLWSQTNTKINQITANKNYKINVDKFLKDKSIPQLSKDLYNNKVKPTDNEENLSLIDSINSKGPAKGFYFLVITKTMKYADGAYAEPLGIAAKEFVEKKTTEFLSYFMCNRNLLTDKDFKNWATTVYGEIQIESEGSEQKAVNDLKFRMLNNCIGQSEKYKTKIDEFIRLMK